MKKYAITLLASLSLLWLGYRIKRSEPTPDHPETHQKAIEQLKTMGGNAGY